MSHAHISQPSHFDNAAHSLYQRLCSLASFMVDLLNEYKKVRAFSEKPLHSSW